jgi:hypothetical protein
VAKSTKIKLVKIIAKVLKNKVYVVRSVSQVPIILQPISTNTNLHKNENNSFLRDLIGLKSHQWNSSNYKRPKQSNKNKTLCKLLLRKVLKIRICLTSHLNLDRYFQIVLFLIMMNRTKRSDRP